MEALDGMKYKELQAKARELGIKSNQKTAALKEAIVAAQTSAAAAQAAAAPVAAAAVAPAAAAASAPRPEHAAALAAAAKERVSAAAPTSAPAAPKAAPAAPVPATATKPAPTPAVSKPARAAPKIAASAPGAPAAMVIPSKSKGNTATDAARDARRRDDRRDDRRTRDDRGYGDRRRDDRGYDRRDDRERSRHSRDRDRSRDHDRRDRDRDHDRRPKKEGGADEAVAEGGEKKPREERSRSKRSRSRSRSRSRRKKHRRHRDHSSGDDSEGSEDRRRRRKKKKKKKKSSLFTEAPPGMAALMQIPGMANMAAALPPGMMSSMMSGIPGGMQPGMPPGMSSGMPPGMPPGMGARGMSGMRMPGMGGMPMHGHMGGGVGGRPMPQVAMSSHVGAPPDRATKPSRELYIGNMPPHSAPEELKAFIAAAMTQGQMLHDSGDPVITVRVSEKFAFAELRSVPETNNAMNMTGIIFNGRSLNIGRPRAYMGAPTQATNWVAWTQSKGIENAMGTPQGGAVAAAAVANPVNKNHRELYLGNCPEGVTEQQLFKFVTDAMNLAKLTVGDNPNPVVQVRVNGRFAFAEFRSVEECNNGLNLNGIELGGTQLRVGRPKAYDGPTVPCGTWSELIAKGLDAIKAQGVPGSGGMPGGYGGQFGASAPLSAGAGLMPTNVLQLANMVTADELADDEEYADILSDIKNEMGKFGVVGRVEIPRTGSGAGQIYVAYGQPSDALKCINGMRGRTFGDNTVAAHFYPENLFLANKFVDVTQPGAAEAAGANAPAAMPPMGAPQTGAMPMRVVPQQQQFRPPPGPPPPMMGMGMPMAGGPPAGRGRHATQPAWMTKS